MQRNFASFYPHLLRTFVDLVYNLGGPDALSGGQLELLGQLVVGCPAILIDKAVLRSVYLAGELPDFVGVAVCLHRATPAAALLLLRCYCQLGHPLRPLAPLLYSFAASGLFAKDQKARLLSWSLACAGLENRLLLLEGFAALAKQGPAIVAPLVKILDSHFLERPASDLLSWLSRGFSLVRSGRAEEASAYFCLQSRESRSFFGLSGALLREEREILRIYCASLAGTEFNILSVDRSSYQVPAAYTDGKSIFLPPELSLSKDTAINRRAYAVLTAMLSALPSNGTYRFDLEDCEFRYDLGNRFGGMLPNLKTNLVLEYGQRIKTIRERRGNILELVFKSGRSLVVLETELEKLFYQFPSPPFMRKLFGILECCRLEARLALRYEGIAQDVSRLNSLVAASLPKLEANGAGEDEGRQLASFLRAVRCLYLLRLGSADTTSMVAGDPFFAGVRGARLYSVMATAFSRLREPQAEVRLTAELAFAIYCQFFDCFPLSAYSSLRHPLLAWRNPLDPELEPAIVASQSPELFPEKFRRFESAGEDEASFVDLTRMSEQEKEEEQKRHDIKSRALRLYAYPEFDCEAQAYLPRHCTVQERVVEGGNEGWYTALVQEHRQLLARIVKKFQSMQPEAVELSRRWYDGDEMHLGDAVDYAVDLLRGAAADERIYQRKVLNTRSVAIQILVDASSSTREAIGDTTVIELEKAALGLLGAALDKLGDSFSIAAYNSNGPQAVSFFLAKDFDEAWSPRVRARLSAISPWSANRDGCAIRHASMRLAQRREKTRLLLLISDGMPADKDYGNSDGSAVVPYALEDTRRSILEAKRAGIVPFCLTIDEKAKEYIGHLYGDYNYSLLSDLAMLPQRLARLYVRLTR